MTQAYNLSQLANRANTSGQLDASSALTNQVPIANGGTGQSTATAALNALLPSQVGNAGKYLVTNGTIPSWIQPTTFNGAQTQTSAADITLTAASVQVQMINLTTTYKRVILPVATTYSVLGSNIFTISNVGTYPFDIAASNGARIKRVLPGQSVDIGLSQNSTATGGWIANGSQVLAYGSFANTNLSSYILENIPFLYGTSTIRQGLKVSSAYSVTALSASAFFVAYIDSATNDVFGVVGTISSNVISWGTPALVVAGSYVNVVCASVDATNVIVAATNTADDVPYRGVIISGTTFTITTTNPTTSTSRHAHAMKRLDSTRTIFCSTDSASTGSTRLSALQISGTTLTLGTSIALGTSVGSNFFSMIDAAILDASNLLAANAGAGGATPTTGQLRQVGVTGTTLTAGTVLVPQQYGANINPIGGGFQCYTISSTEAGFITDNYSGTATISGTTTTLGVITNSIVAPQSVQTSYLATAPAAGVQGVPASTILPSNNHQMTPFGDGNLINSWESDNKQGGVRIYDYVSGVGIFPSYAIDTLTMPRYAVFASLSATTCVAVGLAPNNNGTEATNFFLGATVLTTL